MHQIICPQGFLKNIEPKFAILNPKSTEGAYTQTIYQQ